MNRLLKFITFLGFCCVLSMQFGIPDAAAAFRVTKEQPLQVEAHWELDEESVLNAYRSSPHHAAVLLNLKPTEAIKEHLDNKFDVFLPASGEAAVGEVWAFDVKGVLPFLRQFHPGATVTLSDKLGAVACLRAISPDYAEIIFRFHADFDLEWGKTEEMVAEETVAELSDTYEEQVAAMAKDALENVRVRDIRTELAPAVKTESVVKDEVAPRGEKSEISELTDKLTALSATLTSLEEKLDDRLTALDEKLSELSELTDKLIELSGMLTQLDERLTALERKLDGKFTALEGKLDGKFTILEETLTKQLDSQLTVLENVLTARLAQLSAVYFTPTHFTGRLLMNRKTREVAAFSLKIPDSDAHAVLSTFGRSVPVSVSRMELIGKDDSVSPPDEIKWTTAISVEEAHVMLQSQRPKKARTQQLLLPLTR